MKTERTGLVDSGVPWIGKVPPHWTTKPLWSMFERIKDVGHPEEQMLSVFREYGVVAKDSRDNINKTAENRNIYQLVHPGWLVANRMKAWQGSVGISSFRGIVSGHYICFAPRHGEHHGYLNWLLRSTTYTNGYALLSRGVRIGQAEIDNDEFRVMPILLPPLDEQRAIGDYLDRETARIDTLIEEQQRLIEMLKERKLLIVAHAIPKDGPKGRMKWDTRMVAGGTPATDVDDYWLDGGDDGGTPFVAIGDMSRRRSVRSTAKRLSEDAMTSRAMPVGRPGTLLLAMYASVGEVAMLDIKATWNQAILGIMPDTSRLDANFLRYALLQMRSDLLRDVRSNTQANLNASQVGALWVPMPSLEEQRRIAADLDDQTEKLETMLAETERFIELARERRSALITAAVTGQIDVSAVA